MARPLVVNPLSHMNGENSGVRQVRSPDRRLATGIRDLSDARASYPAPIRRLGARSKASLHSVHHPDIGLEVGTGIG